MKEWLLDESMTLSLCRSLPSVQWFFSDEARAERQEHQRQLEREGLLEYTVLAPGAPVVLCGLSGKLMRYENGAQAVRT